MIHFTGILMHWALLPHLALGVKTNLHHIKTADKQTTGPALPLTLCFDSKLFQRSGGYNAPQETGRAPQFDGKGGSFSGFAADINQAVI